MSFVTCGVWWKCLEGSVSGRPRAEVVDFGVFLSMWKMEQGSVFEVLG